MNDKVIKTICEKCGETRVSYPWVQVEQDNKDWSIWELSDTLVLCKCQREEMAERMIKIMEKASPEIQKLYQDLLKIQQ